MLWVLSVGLLGPLDSAMYERVGVDAAKTHYITEYRMKTKELDVAFNKIHRNVRVAALVMVRSLMGNKSQVL